MVMTVSGAKQVLPPRPLLGPRLVHTILPPYEIPELIVMGGVLVENRGDAAAHNVKVSLEYDHLRGDKIRHLQVYSDVDYILRGGGEQQSFAMLRMRKLGVGERVVVYFSAPTRIQPRVFVTHYEG